MAFMLWLIAVYTAQLIVNVDIILQSSILY